MADLPVDVAGEQVLLLPERALFWPRASTLLIADPHWGKAATFRAAGIGVPGGTTAADLAHLTAALERVGARRVVILGDLFHARQGKVRATLDAAAEWRDRHYELEVILVRGNHDRHAGDPPPDLRIECVDPPLTDSPFVFLHEPEPSEGGYVLAGHLHPAAVLRGRARQRERLPCFWFGQRAGVLPAFGSFTGAAEIRPVPGDRVFVITDAAVIPASA